MILEGLSQTQALVKQLYKDEEGNPLQLSKGQDYIFRSIARKEVPRVHVMCHTRFGKSLTVGLGVLTRAASFPESWAIIAGTKDKSKIIMDHVISHIFDNDFTASRFMPDKGESIDSIRRHRNKNRITFRVGSKNVPIGTSGSAFEKLNLYSDIFIGSAKDALGKGAKNIIEDESALIPDNEHSLVMRMLGDNPYENFLCKIGNPFTRGHFLDSYHDPKYRKIVIDCYKSLLEGRMTQDTIDENRPYAYFDVLYECKFPSATSIDDSGWMYLLTDNDVKQSQQRKLDPAGVQKLGIDVQRGGRNFNVWVVRTNTTAEIVKKTRESNLIPALEDTINIMHEYGISPENVFVDDTGVGGGLTDMLAMRGIIVNGIKLGDGAEKIETIDQSGKEVSKSEYLNVRAEIYAGKEGVMSWIKQGGHLVPSADWIELTRIRYKKDVSSRTKIEPKDDMIKRGVQSPDAADALALTFAKVKKVEYYGNSTLNPMAVLSGSGNQFGGISW